MERAIKELEVKRGDRNPSVDVDLRWDRIFPGFRASLVQLSASLRSKGGRFPVITLAATKRLLVTQN